MKGFSRTMQNNCIIFFSIRVMYLVIEIGLTDLKKFMNKCATNWQVLGMEKYTFLMKNMETNVLPTSHGYGKIFFIVSI